MRPEEGAFLPRNQRTHQAEGLLRQGEIHHSAATSGEALALAQRIGASRCVRQISVLAGGYKPHLKVEGVEQFLGIVRAAGMPPGGSS
ncbi:hypothetical protein [Streptomyces sp. NEAU-L66]|uniref:hypothetical protein n=1 Tax=Streptomyces sp. NEAU-L66 TaxID=3390812 RepID=UPI0039C6FFA7